VKCPWKIPDPAPGQEINSINPFSTRARALVARKLDTEMVSEHFHRLVGVSEMISGMEYHHVNFCELVKRLQGKDDEARPLMRHEAVAYLNRLGQFYYFATSDFVTDLVGDQEGAMPFILKIIPFRHKHSARRSIDFPRGETPEIQDSQSMMLQGSGLMGSPRPGAMDKDGWRPELMWISHYPGYQISLGDGTFPEFYPERDHDKIQTEAYTIFEKVMAKA